MSDPEPSLTARLSGMNPFSKARCSKVDDDTTGEQLDPHAIAGGGHAARETLITKNQLRVSPALRSFLVNKGVLSASDAGLDDGNDEITPALRALLDKPHVKVPPELIDRSHRLPEYFISSSHNTYLIAHQLYGSSSAAAYEVALNTGSRCVEIDAWDNDDNKDEPKVTHGYTLVSHVSFRAVCETIRDVVDKEAKESANAQGHSAAPIFLSLENHCGPHGQLRLVQIMQDVWGDRLLSKHVREKGHEEQGGGEHVTLAELGSKICVIVEHHIPNEAADSDTSSSSSSSSEDEADKAARHQYAKAKQDAPVSLIIPELAAIGVYAQSVKPADNSWFEQSLTNAPHHHLINVSESALAAHLPAHAAAIASHNAHHLMRVYPKGSRISSRNLSPVPFWAVGAQICALNWQSFDAAMQLNGALFAGTDGFVLKPAALRAGGHAVLASADADASPRIKTLRLHVAGASDVPVPSDRDPDDPIKPYLTATLHIPPTTTNPNSPPQKRKTSPYKHHNLPLLHHHSHGHGARTNPPATDPLWNEVLEWQYPAESEEMAFVRLLVKSDDRFKGNAKLCVAAVRVAYVGGQGWVVVRMVGLGGGDSGCGVLVRWEVVG
ncbi:PLC-like phosphodiesterase [Pseudovirgaria hyperparasitica]|uniref:Phosphoinositide phospholipase C n=1 Tax=Pseudovirgaria hyperparasitica TaxID=470096 RepID=A0A6A6W3L5_9PEZI|nr:PLC-like phosphodiesterase [Pseudovirgaria hyperparasitica]KAF2755631.1 PLC-like phosphodiesterase [Pseudovirgaria hyperparasitica]